MYLIQLVLVLFWISYSSRHDLLHYLWFTAVVICEFHSISSATLWVFTCVIRITSFPWFQWMRNHSFRFYLLKLPRSDSFVVCVLKGMKQWRYFPLVQLAKPFALFLELSDLNFSALLIQFPKSKCRFWILLHSRNQNLIYLFSVPTFSPLLAWT